MFFLPIIVTALGIFLLAKLNFFPIIHPVKTARGCILSGADRGGFRSLSLALAGTLGVGNIFGVAISIILGGAGSVFWLLVSSVFSAIIKYAEAVVSVDNLSFDGDETLGGMMYVIKKNLWGGRLLGGLYAVACLLLSLVMGAAMQSSAAVSSATVILGFDKAVFGIAFAVLSAVFIVGRREKIKSITAALIPVAALAYILISCAVIVRYRAELARVVSEIFCLAFTPSAAGGGIAGSLISSPIVRGYSTGILSNEAGAGTSSMAHASDMRATPVAAGLSGMLEVVADTMLLCMLTAFAILLPSPELSDVGGAELVVSSMSGAFLGADWLLFLSVFSFALATVACWYYYGTVCMRYLFGGAGVKFFLPIYLLFVLLGAFYDCAVFAALSDVLLLFLTVLVAPVLIKSSGRIKRLSEQYGIIKGEFSTRVPHKVS